MSLIHIINGPNLNKLGTREPEIYGHSTLDDIMRDLADFALKNSTEIYSVQSNIEGEIVTALQDAGDIADGIILNAAAYTHTSIAIRDAVATVPCPVIEVHLSNIYARERFRHTSLIAPVAKGMITGLGKEGYKLALMALLDIIAKPC